MQARLERSPAGELTEVDRGGRRGLAGEKAERGGAGTCWSSGLGAPSTEDDEVAKEELCSEELVAGGATDGRVEQEHGLTGRAVGAAR